MKRDQRCRKQLCQKLGIVARLMVESHLRGRRLRYRHAAHLPRALGGFTYTPNGQPAGADGFFYRAFDGSLYSCPACVALKLPNVDVDTDSNNNGPIEGTPAEDNIRIKPY